MESCTAQLAEAVRAHSESQELAGSVQKERDQLNLSLAEKDRQIEALNEKCEGLVTEVASHKEDVEALESARKQLVMFEQRISDLQQQQSSDDGAAVRLSKASKEVSQLRDKVEALQTSMSEMESHLNAEIEALSAQLAEKDEQLR